MTCPGCCGCYGWDNFDPKAVSESLKQLLQMKTRIIALSHLWLEWRPAENRSKFPLNGTAEFSRFDYVTCRSCCGCYGWDIFDPRPVSDSLSQNLCLKKKYLPQLNCELSGGWPKKCSKTSIFRIVPRKSAICGIRPPVFSNSLPMNRSRYFRSVDCFWKFDGKTPHEKLFTTAAQSWTLRQPAENWCSKTSIFYI